MNISLNQKGNPCLKYLQIPYQVSHSIAADFELDSIQIYFLSLKYHLLFPEYILSRLPTTSTVLQPASGSSSAMAPTTTDQNMRSLSHNQDHLRALILLLDMEQFHQALQDLTRFCLQANITLLLAWSEPEVCRILETLKAFEHKPPDLIKEKIESLYFPKVLLFGFLDYCMYPNIHPTSMTHQTRVRHNLAHRCIDSNQINQQDRCHDSSFKFRVF
jgi:DNA excision repair protein ERCC-1